MDDLEIRALAASPLAVVGDAILAARPTAMAALAHMESDTPFRLVTSHGKDDAI